MIAIEKNLVEKQFNKGLPSYAKQASVQKQIADRLITRLCSFVDKPLHRLFEVGCGTGFLTQNIMEKLEVEQLMVNDISLTAKSMMSRLETIHQKTIDFIVGDAENIALPQQLDALLTSSTIQWFKSTAAFFEKVSESLNSGAFFAIATFGCQNFKEVKHITGVGLEYKTREELVALLSEYFDILWSEEWIAKKCFSTPTELLRHMKQTGVNGISKAPFGRKQLNHFTQTYQALYANEDNHVHLTYNPIIIIAQKK